MLESGANASTKGALAATARLASTLRLWPGKLQQSGIPTRRQRSDSAEFSVLGAWTNRSLEAPETARPPWRPAMTTHTHRFPVLKASSRTTRKAMLFWTDTNINWQNNDYFAFVTVAGALTVF